jgi:hypothetical protein
MTTTCPVCTRSFRDAHGRGGHIATYNDADHDAFRAQHNLKHPRGPDGKPTVVGLRWRGDAPPAPMRPEMAAPPQPAAAQESATISQAALPAGQPAPEALAATGGASTLPAVAVASTRTPEPKPEEPATAPADGKPSGAGLWTAFLGVGGLAALILASKGKNAPSKPEAAAPGGRPVPRLPEGIWAPIKPKPATTGNEWLDRQLGYSGGITPRRRGFL